MNTNQSVRFSTSDLSTAAYLHASGFEFIGIVESGARVAFEFGPNTSGKSAVDGTRDYLNNAMVPARAFADSLAHFKNVLRDRRDFSSSTRVNRTSTGDYQYGPRSRS